MISSIYFPTNVIIGENASSQTGEKLKQAGVKKVICLYDQGVKAAGIVDKVLEYVKAAGIEIVEFGNVKADPTDDNVNETAEAGRAEKADGVLGIGGGSTMDTAKGVNVLLGNPGRLEDYFNPDAPQKPSKPLFLIPTTSGTGSEVSRVAAIHNTKENFKRPVFGPGVIPTCSIVDPLLTVSLPPRITAYTGLDTLAHAIEAYTTNITTRVSDLLALEAITLVGKSLVTTVKDGSDVQARLDMCYACTLAGMAFATSFLHVGHALGTWLGTKFELQHGLSIALVLPWTMEFIGEAVPAEKMENIARALGVYLPRGISSKEAGSIVAEALRVLNKTVGIPKMNDLFSIDELPSLVEGSFKDLLIDFTPKDTTYENVLESLQKEYAL